MLKVAFVFSPGFSMMSLAAVSVFEMANRKAREPLYAVHLLSEGGGAVASSIGASIETQPLNKAGFDTVIVTAAIEPEPAHARVLAFVRRASRTARRLASVCTGAFVLAEAGLLDGRRATTHWFQARELQRRFPRIKVEEDRIFIIDGPIWTSAGMSACIDLALGMVEKDLGADLARAVAQSLVLYHRRAGGQSQHSAMLQLDAKSDRIQTALDYARRNLRAPLTVDQLAEAAHLSARQFSRAFKAETGQSPAKAIERLRVEAARLLVERGRHSIGAVAAQTGFADRERMRRAFLRSLGQPPQVVRRNARGGAVAR